MWNWTDTHRQCYKRLKELVGSATVPKYYDVTDDVTISVDALSTGLRAVLLQNNQPVAFASKALTETQRKYAQIEKEMLAIVFGCTKFHQYIFGKKKSRSKVTINRLKAIYKKPLYLAPVRLQKMILKLQRYEIRVQYKKGTELYFADTLSRAYLPDLGLRWKTWNKCGISSTWTETETNPSRNGQKWILKTVEISYYGRVARN